MPPTETVSVPRTVPRTVPRYPCGWYLRDQRRYRARFAMKRSRKWDATVRTGLKARYVLLASEASEERGELPAPVALQVSMALAQALSQHIPKAQRRPEAQTQVRQEAWPKPVVPRIAQMQQAAQPRLVRHSVRGHEPVASRPVPAIAGLVHSRP